MKVKFALSLVGISSIHLLQTFLRASEMTNDAVMWQVVIHLTFVFSALIMAYTNRLMIKPKKI